MEFKNNEKEVVIGNNSEASYVKVYYKECQKNKAVDVGGHALDGCCEFLPAGDEGSVDYLKCGACNCHRNFHKKEIVGVVGDPNGHLNAAEASEGTLIARPMPLSIFPNRGDIFGKDLPENVVPNGEGSSNSRRRSRTKFSHGQKEKMLDFALKLGWKIKKQDDNVVEEFCNEIGVNRHVFNVWMYNNKHTLGKKHLKK